MYTKEHQEELARMVSERLEEELDAWRLACEGKDFPKEWAVEMSPPNPVVVAVLRKRCETQGIELTEWMPEKDFGWEDAKRIADWRKDYNEDPSFIKQAPRYICTVEDSIPVLASRDAMRGYAVKGPQGTPKHVLYFAPQSFVATQKHVVWTNPEQRRSLEKLRAQAEYLAKQVEKP